MKFKLWLLTFSFLLFFPLFSSSVFAVPNITITSHPAEARVNEELELSISCSSLDPNSEYYIKARLGSSSSEMNKGETLNQSTGNWLGDTDTWSNFPTFSSSNNGEWSDNLRARAKSDAILGENLLTIRLRKVGASSNTGDSSPVTINITEALPTATPTPTPTPTSSPTPTNTPTPSPTPASNSISGSFSSPQTVGEEFDISVTLSNFEASKEYYLKARIGLSESELNKGETYNDGSWYSDTSSWSNFPKITTNSSGNYSGSITAKLKSEQNSGNYKLRVRAKKVDGETNYDSPAYDITFNSASFSPTPTPTPTPTPKPNTPTPTPTPTAKVLPTPTANSDNPEVLGEEATESGLFLLGESTTSAMPTPEESRQPREILPLVLIGLGAVLIGGALVPFLPKEKLKGVREKIGGIIKPTEL